MFMHFVVYGLYNFLFEEFEKPWLLVVGFTGLLFSHMISFTIACMLCAVVSVFRIKHLIRNGYKLIRLLVAVLLVAGLSCVFWLPLLEQMLSGRILITNGRTMQSMSVAADQLRVVTASAQGILGRDSPTMNDLRRLLKESTDTMRSMRALAEMLERNPEALLRGKQGTR